MLWVCLIINDLHLIFDCVHIYACEIMIILIKICMQINISNENTQRDYAKIVF